MSENVTDLKIRARARLDLYRGFVVSGEDSKKIAEATLKEVEKDCLELEKLKGRDASVSLSFNESVKGYLTKALDAYSSLVEANTKAKAKAEKDAKEKKEKQAAFIKAQEKREKARAGK